MSVADTIEALLSMKDTIRQLQDAVASLDERVTALEAGS